MEVALNFYTSCVIAFSFGCYRVDGESVQPKSYVEIFKDSSFKGFMRQVNLTSSCNSVEDFLSDHGRIGSINSKDNCINVYQDENCSGVSITLKPGNPFHDVLAWWRRSHVKVKAIGLCHDVCHETNIERSIEAANVELFQNKSFQGTKELVTIRQGSCSSLSTPMRGVIMSFRVHPRACIELHEFANCNGFYRDFPVGSPSHKNLKHWDWGENRRVESISLCGYRCNRTENETAFFSTSNIEGRGLNKTTSGSTAEIFDPNCLRGHIGALDAEFSFENRYEDHSNINGEDFEKHISLISTRFIRAHKFSSFSKGAMKGLKFGISRFFNNPRQKFELFLSASNSEKTSNLCTAVAELKEEYASVVEVNSGEEGPVVGLYLKRLMDTWEREVDAIAAAFGPKENSSFPVGSEFPNCKKMFNDRNALIYLKRLHFITCDLPVVRKPSAEESADDIISTCDELRDNALEIEVTAEIRCEVGYPSYGVSTEGVVGSLLNFQKFWCRIISVVTRESTHAHIIMMSAFDDTPYNYKDETTDLDFGEFHRGWWRRRVTTSYGANAFVEKVDELERNGVNGNCTEECNFCRSNEECCDRTICSIDSSFQPFEMGGQVHVCQSQGNTCAPRFPDSSASRLPKKHAQSPMMIPTTQASAGLLTQPPNTRKTNITPNSSPSALPTGRISSNSGLSVFICLNNVHFLIFALTNVAIRVVACQGAF